MKGWRVGGLMAASVLVLSACVLTASSTSQPPVSSPTPSPSPTPTPTSALAASSAPFHAGEVGVDYAPVAFAASGGLAPYTWSISTGALPSGLSLSSDGSVSGNPTSPGTFTFTVQVMDSGGGSATLPGTIGIAADPVASLVAACTRACSVEAGCVNVCGNFGALRGGTAPFRYSVTGYVPPGTHLNGLSYAGTFLRPVSYWQSTVTVTDAFGQRTSISPIFNVFAHISLASGVCSGGFGSPPNGGCTARLKFAGGSGTPTVKLLGEAPNSAQGCWDPKNATPLPVYSIAVGGGYLTVSITGPMGGYGGIWTLALTDQSLCAANTYCPSPGAALTIGLQCG